LTDDELRLLLASGIGPVLHRRLLGVFGSASAVVNASIASLALVEGIGPRRAGTLRRAIDAADPGRERAALAAIGASILPLRSAAFPRLLAAIPDPPPALWIRGSLSCLAVPAVAIVGSRRCSLYGREQATSLASGLAECGFTVVSGGARGIDAAAHRAALRAGGWTVAVLGCGLGHCYPPEHAELFEQIAGAGALLSELPIGMPPRAEGFPRRNRLISGLTVGVVVVEAALRSGALITAREAVESHHREVMALPGPVDSPVSAGCHLAIREGWAGLVTNVADVLAQLASTGLLLEGARSMAAAERAGDAADECEAATAEAGRGREARERGRTEVNGAARAQAQVLAQLREGGEVPAETLARLLALPIEQVLSALTLLQIEGRVQRGARGFGRRRKG